MQPLKQIGSFVDSGGFVGSDGLVLEWLYKLGYRQLNPRIQGQRGVGCEKVGIERRLL